MFNYRERMLSHVERWGTSPRLHRQSVADHSFYVVLYTDQLTGLLKWPHARRYKALHWATIHDAPEAVTGDIIGPLKRTVVNKKGLNEYEARVYDHLGADYYNHDASDWQVRDVVKAANLIDEVFYQTVEAMMGNKFFVTLVEYSKSRCVKALVKIGLFDDVWPMVEKELGLMEHGQDMEQNDDDLNG